MQNFRLEAKIQYIIILLLIPISLCKAENSTFVDSTIGGIPQLLKPTYPTYHLPNQMIRMFPISDHYIDDQIRAFPLQVVSHRSPGIMRMRLGTGQLTPDSWTRSMTYDHDLEVRHPWLFSTYFPEEEMTVSFTPGEKCAIYRIQFPQNEQKFLLFRGTTNFEPKVINQNTFTLKQKIHYTQRGVDPKTRVMDVYAYAELTHPDGTTIHNADLTALSNQISIVLGAESPSTVLLKYGISYISHEQAKSNFEREVASVTFDELISQGKAAWDVVLNQIDVEGGTTAQKRTFYTALYRTYERMININECERYYSAYDGKVHQSSEPFYVDDWVWDSYLTHHPLRIILNPEVEVDMLNSYIRMYEQSGLMPTFPAVFGNQMAMNSYHSSAIFLDAYQKGLRGYDIEKAYEGIKKNLTEVTLLPWRQGAPRGPLDDFYDKLGFMPALRPDRKETELMVDSFEKRQSVAVTLGISFDSWVLSQLARELGKRQDQEIFSKKALNYRNLWHSGEDLFMPKDVSGGWIDINPKLDGGPGGRDYYDENNGWTYAWGVQHDIDGLIELLDGKQSALDRLDQFFKESTGENKYKFAAMFPDSTGMSGQFSMGNEPSFHIPYLYNYFGAPWKTQKRIRLLLDVWFTDTYFGIPGDEDGGAMSAFVVFSQMGLYPMVPGLPYYTIGSPVFEKVTIQLTNGNTFTVLAPGANKQNKYIHKAFLNERELEGPFLTHQDMINGGTLKLILKDKPNKKWGVEATPPF